MDTRILSQILFLRESDLRFMTRPIFLTRTEPRVWQTILSPLIPVSLQNKAETTFQAPQQQVHLVGEMWGVIMRNKNNHEALKEASSSCLSWSAMKPLCSQQHKHRDHMEVRAEVRSAGMSAQQSQDRLTLILCLWWRGLLVVPTPGPTTPTPTPLSRHNTEPISVTSPSPPVHSPWKPQNYTATHGSSSRSHSLVPLESDKPAEKCWGLGATAPREIPHQSLSSQSMDPLGPERGTVNVGTEVRKRRQKKGLRVRGGGTRPRSRSPRMAGSGSAGEEMQRELRKAEVVTLAPYLSFQVPRPPSLRPRNPEPWTRPPSNLGEFAYPQAPPGSSRMLTMPWCGSSCGQGAAA